MRKALNFRTEITVNSNCIDSEVPNVETNDSDENQIALCVIQENECISGSSCNSLAVLEGGRTD
jgi:hypothetical protein